MLELIRRHKIISAAIALNVIAILVVVLLIVVHRAKTVSIDIYVAPSDAIIELNGKKYDNFASYNLMPGEYHVSISMDGMKTKEYDLALENDGFARIWEYLVDDDGSLNYYLENPDEISILTKFSDDEEVKKVIEYYDKVVSIRDALPLEYYDRSDPDNSVGVFVEEDMNECVDKILCLVIYGGEKNRDIALGLIKEAGYNPDDYGIRFEEE